MRIVRFPSGYFAIRRFSLIHMDWVYKDFTFYTVWCHRRRVGFNRCVSRDESMVRQQFERLAEKGEPV